MEILPNTTDTEVASGDLVSVREATWRVVDVRRFARIRVVRLIGADARNRWQPRTLLEPFDRVRPVASMRAPRVVSRAQWMRTLAALVAASPSPECPATVAQAQVTLMPHQIAPLLVLLRGEASRLLLADAVGLGKTIQAALILCELRARGCADRVLVLVPCGLRDQWQQELSHRTGLPSVIVDAPTLAARAREVPPDVNPWTLPAILIVSLDFIKQPGVLRGADRIAWDVLIVDEAHGLTEGTERMTAVDALARRSRHVMLLTATPHHGSDEAFAALCGTGQMGSTDTATAAAAIATATTGHATAPETDPMVIFRRTRLTMGMLARRRVHVWRVALTRQERWLHTLLARYADRVERDGLPGDAAALALSVLIKRASSSASSLERSLRRRLAVLDDRSRSESTSVASARPGSSAIHASRAQLVQPPLPFEDERDATGQCDDEDAGDRDPVQVLRAPGLRSARIERAWLTLLIEAARNAARDESKPRALARWLCRVREPALIYTEYRDTLTQLASALPRDLSHAVLHGGLGADARRLALSRFTSGDARLLLTTDAAGEGLNLHHRCRLVFNVELPWNPNRLEQRIGRVDRLGQTRTVHAVHLVAAGTAEEQMLDRLTSRVHRIATTLGDGPDILTRPPRVSAASRDIGNSAADRSETPTTTLGDGPDILIRARQPTSASHHVTVGEAGARDPHPSAKSTPEREPTPSSIVVLRELQLIRAAQARAWRVGRRREARDAGTHVRPADPLVALETRAPLVAVAARGRARRALGVDANAPGLLCIWRTRTVGVDERARPPVLTAIHVACMVPRLARHRQVVSFVTSTLDRCRDEVTRVLDREVERAIRRVHEAERPRRERLARRDAAIAVILREHTDAIVQPLLFEEIAAEQARAAATVVPYGQANRGSGAANSRRGEAHESHEPNQPGGVREPSEADHRSEANGRSGEAPETCPANRSGEVDQSSPALTGAAAARAIGSVGRIERMLALVLVVR